VCFLPLKHPHPLCESQLFISVYFVSFNLLNSACEQMLCSKSFYLFKSGLEHFYTVLCESQRLLLTNTKKHSFHPSIHFPFLLNPTQGRAAVIEREAGYTLDRLPVHYRAKKTWFFNEKYYLLLSGNINHVFSQVIVCDLNPEDSTFSTKYKVNLVYEDSRMLACK